VFIGSQGHNASLRHLVCCHSTVLCVLCVMKSSCVINSTGSVSVSSSHLVQCGGSRLYDTKCAPILRIETVQHVSITQSRKRDD
jgi:hypothetical protein